MHPSNHTLLLLLFLPLLIHYLLEPSTIFLLLLLLLFWTIGHGVFAHKLVPTKMEDDYSVPLILLICNFSCKYIIKDFIHLGKKPIYPWPCIYMLLHIQNWLHTPISSGNHKFQFVSILFLECDYPVIFNFFLTQMHGEAPLFPHGLGLKVLLCLSKFIH